MKIRLVDLRKAALRRPGMWQDFITVGQRRGMHLELAREEYERLRDKWMPGAWAGRAAHAVAGPVARVVDTVLGTNLEGCGGCGSRELKMDAATAKEPI